MDATLRLRPLLALSAWLLPLAVATADEPCVDDCFETPALCATTPDECGSDSCRSGVCGARNGGRCTCGNGCACRSGSCRRGTVGNWREWGDEDDDDDGHGEWFDDVHDTGPVGSSQKCHHGKMWPPYPRPAENGEWSTQYHAAMYWPHPYNCWDRSWVKQISAIQVANGWAQATTLCDYHFDAETHRLTPTGVMQLRWILEQCPAQYRTIYIQSGASGGVSEARLAAVRNEAAAMEGLAVAPIQVRPVQLAGRPATEVDMIRRSELSTMPRPRVMVDQVGTGSGDGGQGNGGTGGRNNGSNSGGGQGQSGTGN
jgi:hypothetical protein